MMKLHDLVSFIRFSLIDSPHIKTSRPIDKLSFFFFNKCILPIDRQNLSMQRRCFSYHRHQTFAGSLTLKTRTVTECDLQPPASALTETGNKKI